MPRVITVKNQSDIAGAADAAVSALRAGSLVGLPGSTAYAAATLASDATALIGRSQPTHDLWLAVHDAAQAADLAPDLPARLRRLLGRCWPGPLVVKVPVQDGAFPALPEGVQTALKSGEPSVHLAAPGNSFVQEVMSQLDAPLVWSADSSSETQLATAAQFADVYPDAELVLDTGSVPYSSRASVVEVSDGDFTVVFSGMLSEQAIHLSACQIYLFICTGNTCRSPLAEGLFRNLLAERLQCPPDQLSDRGYLVQSAGLAAATGSPASHESVEVLQRRSIDISGHVSQPLSEQLLEASDFVFTMTNSHRDAILRFRADLKPKVQVLRRSGEDVVDPIGGGMSEYERCEREIEESLRAIIRSHFDEGCET